MLNKRGYFNRTMFFFNLVISSIRRLVLVRIIHQNFHVEKSIFLGIMTDLTKYSKLK
jgi:hypothetical protein